MLEDLLDILRTEGISNPQELAHRLDTSREMVDELLKFLVKAGKVQQLSGNSLVCVHPSCSGCGIAHPCPKPAHPISPSEPSN